MTVSTLWGKLERWYLWKASIGIKSELVKNIDLSEKIDLVKETGEKRHYNVSESDKGGTSDLKKQVKKDTRTFLKVIKVAQVSGKEGENTLLLF